MAVIIGGKDIRNTPEQVSKNTLDIEDLKSRDYTYKSDIVDTLYSYQTKKPLSANQGRILKDMLNQAIAGVFHYKGSVATFADLPSSGMEIGDTYNVLDTGNNFTWDGTGWDQLSGLVDLSAYYTKTESDAKFVDLATNQTITGEKTFDNHIKPLTDASYDLGDASHRWRTLYLSNYLNLSGFVDSNLRPRYNNTYDLGTSTNTFKDLYLGGTAYIGSYKVFTDGAGYFAIHNSTNINCLQMYHNSWIMPGANNVMDLGYSTRQWKNIYLAGNLTDGTNSVNVADLAALIAYAKAQGWIS